ncbi:protein phosphatase 1 regulatory subunit 12A isoform X3 [Diprion similis]|uniref:protein phosphatase 1 regulatory subunit 12A isoform X3 n=1 Tax=Diprion similis TaxID=362088 RepID=UPI001EF80B1A|nr:protein phosphatase 1 regulatory subunit 12A isoform X3 [Diprion similis]
MSLETRSSSALFKRAEQLKRWETSETNREPPHPRQIDRKIKFSADCVYLAACAAGDKEEVIRLLQKGADINTGNVDGLTALHQACIDDDLDMVEFLVEQGADINRGDNEGWTPLHATASCGFISIAKYLIEQGCNLAAVNNDGQLAVDIAESNEMEDMLYKFINEAGIDIDQARSEEARLMMIDARAWCNGAPGKDTVHPRTGATALHVAAAKGYLKVMSTLLQASCDVNAQDLDGWTPLHGAAHWGQLEACKILVEKFCDMDIKNHSGQTAFDVADPDILNDLEELRQKQILVNQGKTPSMKRELTNDENQVVTPEGPDIYDRKTPKVLKVEVKIQSDKDDSGSTTNSDVEGQVETDMDASDGEGDSETSSQTHSSTNSDHSNKSNQSEHSACLTDDEKKNRVNRDETAAVLPSSPMETNKVPIQAPILPPKQQTDNNEDGAIPSWRRSGSFRSRNQESETTNSIPTRMDEKEKPSTKSPSSPNKIAPDSEVVLRRTHSFETDEKFYKQYKALQARIKASSCPSLHRCNPASPTHTNTTTARSASLRETHRRKEVKLNLELTRVQTGSMPPPTSLPNSTTTPVTNFVSAATGTITTSPAPANQFRRSFVPPVRDEESETQRKAHAKRVRETRRSTQGVTLDEIKSAEQLVKKKQQQNSESPAVTAPSTQPAASVSNSTSITATITTATPTTVSANKPFEETNLPERRPSWRLRVDNGSKFQLEDANNRTSTDTTTAYIRRPSGGAGVPRPSSAPVETIAASTTDTTITLPLRRPLKPPEDKEQDKENDSRNAQATQAVIQRRRRPKRRSTGVVHVDMDEIDPDRQDTSASGDYEDSKVNHNESGNERSGRSSRLGSVSSVSSDTQNPPPTRTRTPTSENGELDYKKLYEESQAENERLKDKLRRSDEQLKETKSLLDKAQTAQTKNSLSEAEKRERRAMERKLSEMEEELKQLQKLKAENERLKAENRALTRVVSKLTNTTK